MPPWMKAPKSVLDNLLGARRIPTAIVLANACRTTSVVNSADSDEEAPPCRMFYNNVVPYFPPCLSLCLFLIM
ncbi:hypothetical protein SDJN02_22572, partial [Cucurbita argyrosperma subsp. argyrosperma]